MFQSKTMNKLESGDGTLALRHRLDGVKSALTLVTIWRMTHIVDAQKDFLIQKRLIFVVTLNQRSVKIDAAW